MLSIAEFSGVHFPTFKVKTLTLKTTILRSAVLGIAKLLQNSPELKKIVFYKTEDWNCSVVNFTILSLLYYKVQTNKKSMSFAFFG